MASVLTSHCNMQTRHSRGVRLQNHTIMPEPREDTSPRNLWVSSHLMARIRSMLTGRTESMIYMIKLPINGSCTKTASDR